MDGGKMMDLASVWQRICTLSTGLLVLAFVLLSGHGQAQGAPNVLTAAQVAAFESLVGAAKKVDPSYLQAQATDAQKRSDLSALSAVSGTLSAGAGVTMNSAGGFDQVLPSFRLSLSVDLPKLAGAATGANTPQLVALTASTSGAARDLRVRVLQAYVSYLSAVRSAGVAADALEVATAAVSQAQLRAQAGVLTGLDVMKAAQGRNSADAALYGANLSLAVAKQQLSAISGLTLAELDGVLQGAKPRP
jgi:outer membrane protein TolC